MYSPLGAEAPGKKAIVAASGLKYFECDVGANSMTRLAPAPPEAIQAARVQEYYNATWLDLRAGQRILDAGCGVGGSAMWLAQAHAA